MITLSEPNPNNPSGGNSVPVNQYTNQLKNTDLTSPLTRFADEFFINYTVDSVDPETGGHYKDIIRFEEEDELKEKWIKTFVECFECAGGLPKPNLLFDKRTVEKYKAYRMPFTHEKG